MQSSPFAKAKATVIKKRAGNHLLKRLSSKLTRIAKIRFSFFGERRLMK